MSDPGAGWGSVRRLGSRLRRGSGGQSEDEAELREAYREHSWEIFRLALRSLADRGLAEEVVQETFVRYWQNRGRFDARRGSLRTWLFAIARNLIVDAARARAARPSGPREESRESQGSQEPQFAAGGPGAGSESTRPEGEDPMETTVLRLRLEEALSKLSEDHRTVIVEVHYRGRSYTELAGELGVPPGTLRSRMYYALKTLRLTLEETEDAEETERSQ